LILRLTGGCFPQDYCPTVADFYTGIHSYEGETFKLCVYDTAGSEDYGPLRVLPYVNADLFILCTTLVVPASNDVPHRYCRDLTTRFSDLMYQEVFTYWPKGRDCHILLVGTKSDLRTDPASSAKRKEENLTFLTKEQGEEFAEQIGAMGYVECSALTGEGIDNLQETIFRWRTEQLHRRSVRDKVDRDFRLKNHGSHTKRAVQ
jgi:GTPase SAR1 family protein